MDDLSIKSIDSFQCKEWFIYKHYAKRFPTVEFAFGLFKADKLIGVCSFGSPPRVMNMGECIFNNLRIKTCELNRLCVNDGLEKNTLSFFVSRCLKLLPRPFCVVSYSDHTFGHHGYIYQATNFIYTGLNQIHERQIFYDGKEVHPRKACRLGFTNISEWAKNDSKVILGEYTQKHRYFIFLGSKTIVDKMKKDLIYPILPFPKGENTINPKYRQFYFKHNT